MSIRFKSSASVVTAQETCVHPGLLTLNNFILMSRFIVRIIAVAVGGSFLNISNVSIQPNCMREISYPRFCDAQSVSITHHCSEMQGCQVMRGTGF